MRLILIACLAAAVAVPSTDAPATVVATGISNDPPPGLPLPSGTIEAFPEFLPGKTDDECQKECQTRTQCYGAVNYPGNGGTCMLYNSKGTVSDPDHPGVHDPDCTMLPITGRMKNPDALTCRVMARIQPVPECCD